MQDAEKDKYNDTALKYNKYFVPIQWCYSLLYEARTQGKISADVMLNEIMKQIGDYRKGLGQVFQDLNIHQSVSWLQLNSKLILYDLRNLICCYKVLKT